ncbi:response regulator [Virgibacillus necropolis]|uniref:DNA-binding response regulator n=1 Tax=Virgibacillus necropolis TaxID=163877 RepID=A0A221MI62_9BACI|nr:response regulator [Virgibacillus necropolis]ASN07310.1 DNA-binding response regulator [Virgibacillus necropolis]
MIDILIAEDDYRVGNIHAEFLSKIADVKVVGKALNGKETLELIENLSVDLILLDIFMPDILGTELIRHIRDSKPNIDIIMISAATDKSTVEEAIRSGIFDYIIKPVKMDRFIETIEKYKHSRKILNRKAEVDQSFLDDYFGHQHHEIHTTKNTPKGIDPLTLEKVKEIMEENRSGTTAEEMGFKIGASRTTARRYLEYLISIGVCTAQLEYGIVGRPERKYLMNKKTS